MCVVITCQYYFTHFYPCHRLAGGGGGGGNERSPRKNTPGHTQAELDFSLLCRIRIISKQVRNIVKFL